MCKLTVFFCRSHAAEAFFTTSADFELSSELSKTHAEHIWVGFESQKCSRKSVRNLDSDCTISHLHTAQVCAVCAWASNGTKNTSLVCASWEWLKSKVNYGKYRLIGEAPIVVQTFISAFL